MEKRKWRLENKKKKTREPLEQDGYCKGNASISVALKISPKVQEQFGLRMR